MAHLIEPSEIVIRRSYSLEASIVQISMSTSALNHLFSSPLQSEHALSKEQPSVLRYTFPDQINEMRYKIFSRVEHHFEKPLDIMDTVSKLSSAQNLFVFFANHYLPLESGGPMQLQQVI